MSYDETGSVVENPNLETGCLIEEYSYDGTGKMEKITRYHEYTVAEIEELTANAEANTRAEEKDAWLAEAPVIQEEQDAAICDLYEQSLAHQEESDEAITSLYEMLIGE